MDTTTQPILCCIGEKVAGKPTQFLMQRAFASEHLDWRAITVEVDPQNFASALAGMTVMNFMAIRFFSSLQSLALRALAADDPYLCFVGEVTSAAHLPTGWSAWHHQGLAIRDWACRQIEFSKTICWLQGDSVLCRSFVCALQNQPLPQAIVWQDPPAEMPEQLLHLRHSDFELPIHTLTTDQDKQLPEWDNLSRGATSLVGVGEVLSGLSNKASDTIERCLLVGSGRDKAKSIQLALGETVVMSEGELTIACEAYDLWRWTARQVDLGLLRDAYDEYCDF